MSNRILGPAGVLAGASLAGILLLGCQGGSGVSSPAATPIPTKQPSLAAVAPALDKTYTSAVYGYSIDHPEYFSVRPATRRLDGAETPWVDSAGVDQLNAAAVIVIGSGDLAAGMDLDGWTQKTARQVCGEPTSTDPVTVGGQPGRLLSYAGCYGYFHLWATTTYGTAGYHLVWVHDPGTETEDRQLFEAILATFRFGPPAASPSPS